MTKMAHGPSLPQARDSNTNTEHQHHHRHLHSHVRARHHHSGDNTEPNHVRSHENHQPHQRDALDLESDVITQVVQTVSVVQVVDGSGATVDVKTYYPDSATQPETSALGLTTADSSVVDSAAPTTASLPSSNDDFLSTDSSTASTLSSTLSHPGTLTSAPSSTFTSFPSLSGVYNATSRPSFFNNTSLHSLFPNTTTASIHSNTSFSFSISTAHSSSSILTSTTEVPTVFGNGNPTGAGTDGVGATLTVLPTSTSTASSSSGGPLDPTTKSLVGGIVGGFAGLALVALTVLIAIKWKRQHGQGIQLLTDGDSPDTRRLSMFSHGGGPGGGHGSFAIPAALASLTGHGQASQASIGGAPEASEKGFYRVSGRKLTSVLQSGGDGYDEPSADNRESTISNMSSYRPDSIAMFADPKTSPLQLGSPMRPESGIMIMRSGPARTPVQEQGPIFDDAAPLTPPTSSAVDHDPLGRSLLAQSGSKVSTGSPSRFTERLS